MFAAKAWQQTDRYYKRILKHPFVQGLAAGNLPEACFIYYLQQDALFLLDYSKALSAAALHARLEGELAFLLELADDNVWGSRYLLDNMFTVFKARPVADKSPACFTCCAYLLSLAATGGYHQMVAALTPSMWIYEKIGKHLMRHSIAHNPYQAWIDTFVDSEYEHNVRRMVALLDAVASRLSESSREEMMEAFVISFRLEYLFFDDASALRQWRI